MKKCIFRAVTIMTILTLHIVPIISQNKQTILPTTDSARPGIRWWWLGSAVDSTNLTWNLEQFAKAGIGTVEITPIYGVQGNEMNDIDYLSPKWMESLRQVEKVNARLGIETDMATGTGWPFGGPWVSLSEAACKAVVVDTMVEATIPINNIAFNMPERERSIAKPITIKEYMENGNEGKKRVIALYESRTRQQVKRAAPGGEGFVVDHFDSTAVAHYLAHIDSAFTASGTPFPTVFFNDSYEVYGANWTPTLPEVFEQRHGYSLIDSLKEFVDGDPKVVSDYRETLAYMLLNNFTRQWTAWAHSRGAKTRNQAHGSPANLIDCYAAVDIPEIEGFGLTDFGIKGLRRDPGFTRRNDSDLSMLKYAPSAAHITGKTFTSSETFTWLTEHFRTSLSQMKPDLDLMFCAGVNRMFFHGAAYSPKDDPWPGWRFYASVDMSPTNSIWRDAPELMRYITRCQTYLQWGKPDNDFLVYLPVRNLWRNDTRNWLMQFDIHSMAKKAPQFIKTILDIDKAGFDCDYISDQYLLTTTFRNGMLETAAGTRYKGIIIPASTTLPSNVESHINQLRQQGAKIIFGNDAAAMGKAAKPEAMKKELGLKMIRRINDEGHHYFIANLTDHDICQRIPLATNELHAFWINPMTNETNKADLNQQGIEINLRSGESRILVCSNNESDLSVEQNFGDKEIDLTENAWRLSFVEEQPKVSETFKFDALKTWEDLSEDAATTMGTGVYETTFNLSKADAAKGWTIDLGDVRESARVYINDKYIGCAWAVPFSLNCKNALKKGKNTLRIEVTNLPANRIADLDRKGVVWRKMKEINVVDINYKKTSYANWEPVASGLKGKVVLKGRL
ncbi:MAG: glycosyl hydrolase [Prevotella sp.]